MYHIEKEYSNHKKQIDEICKINGISIEFLSKNMIVKGKHEYWKIVSDVNNIFTLFHENINPLKIQNNMIVRTYHYQDKHSESLVEMFTEIVEHDKYKSSKIKRRKKYKNILKSMGVYRGKG